ncbi:hypothetical protein U9M48_026374 [Paspalum notatum var. saurae]|uniref:Uncharacterized protein n=1 Tax=Paspalum notatum var. saurae TaxID=547442 RepID=A0AAQ3TWE0_PASNO
MAPRRLRPVLPPPLPLPPPPPALLGFIMSVPPPEVYYSKGAGTSFVRVPSRNPHLDAAVAAPDFYLEDFTANNPRPGYEWILHGCDGRPPPHLRHEEVAVYDPIGRNAVFLRPPDVLSHAIDLPHVFEALFSFRRIMGAVFDSRTGEWAALPTLENDSFSRNTRWYVCRPVRLLAVQQQGIQCQKQQQGILMTSWSQSHVPERTLVLDTNTMEWTLIQVPFPAKESYYVADMAEHGGPCLVAKSSR